MSKDTEIYFQQQQLLKTKGKSLIENPIDVHLVQRMMDREVDQSNIKPFSFVSSIMEKEEITEQEVYGLLDSIRERFREEKFDEIASQLKSDVLHAIVVPFGIGKILSAYDKTGGNVTTIHNAKQGIYAQEKDSYVRHHYDKSKNSDGQQFSGNSKKSVGSQFTRSHMDECGQVIDEYTGKLQPANTTSPDHIASLSGFHKNGGYMLNTTRKADFATDQDNLALTDRSINQSVKDTNKDDWSSKQSSKDKAVTNSEYYDINSEMLRKATIRGKETADKYAPTTTEKAQYYAVNSAKTGAMMGVKMGFQQALGMVIVELFSNIIHELKVISKEGVDKDNWVEELSNRFKKIAENVLSKWKEALHAFKDGVISGFISNIVTTLINIVATTAKRTVRILREGVFSLYNAIRMLAFPPEGMTFAETAHEAMKLIFAGGIVIGGIALEEVLEKLVLSIPLLVPIADILVGVLIGSLTAIAMGVMAYFWDKIDLFGAIKNKQDDFVLKQLELKSSWNEINSIVDDFIY